MLNGGRLYIDMGHLEYSSPECRTVEDSVSYDLAGDELLQSALEALGVSEEVAFIKNNVDHHTGATFGCHENYLMKRELQFSPRLLGTLLSFLATRQLFTGAGRVGQASPLAFDFEPAPSAGAVPFQLSQRADHIVNDIYQWVQFNRAIINARDEPLADYRKYRRLHLLIGDSNMSPFATALKIGTTALILTLLEEGSLPDDVILLEPCWPRDRSPRGHRPCRGATGGRAHALGARYPARVPRPRPAGARRARRGDRLILETWAFTLDALANKPELLLGGVDWVSKKWLLETFRESEGLSWQDPWLQSLDLEYHNINPAKGLFFALTAAKGIGEFNQRLRRPAAALHPPADTRACGRGLAVSIFQDRKLPYVINWDSISLDNTPYLPMPDPFETYTDQVKTLLEAPLEPLG